MSLVNLSPDSVKKQCIKKNGKWVKKGTRSSCSKSGKSLVNLSPDSVKKMCVK